MASLASPSSSTTSPNPPSQRASQRAQLGAIFLTVFLDLLGFGLVMPFLALEARERFGVSELVATLLGSVYSLMQFLFVPVWGRVSDRVGRRPVLLWSIAGTSMAMAGLGVGLAFGGSIAWLFVARLLAGVATANLGTASAYIADVTKPEDRAKGMGLIGAAFGLGFILGPAVGGALAKIPVNGHDGALPCFVAAGLSLVNLAWASFGLGESLPQERRAQAGAARRWPLDPRSLRVAFSRERPGFALVVTVNFLVVWAFTNLDQTFTFFNHDLFAIDERGTGYLLAFVGVVAAFVQGGLIRPLSKRVEDAWLVRVGVILQAFAFAGFVVAGGLASRALLYASSAVLALGNGMSQPGTSAYVSKCAPLDAQGETLGTHQAVSSLARTFGPASGGLLYATIGARAPYGFAAIGMLIAFSFALALRPHPRG